MKAKYHVSPRTHRAEPCRSGRGENSRGCPFGDSSPHFDTVQEAEAFIEMEAAENNSEIPQVVVEREAPQISGIDFSRPKLTPYQIEKCSRIIDPSEGRRISDSISMLENPDHGWALEKRGTHPNVSNLVMRYEAQFERVEEASRKKANIEWRGRNAKSEQQRESYRQQWRVANRELDQANRDFQSVKNERNQALRYFKSYEDSRRRLQETLEDYHSNGEFEYRKFSQEEAQEIAEKSNLYKVLQDKVRKGDDESLKSAAQIHGSQHLIRDIDGFVFYRQESQKEERSVDELTKKIALTDDPSEKKKLSDMRDRAKERKLKADDLMGKYAKAYRTLVKDVENGGRECDEAFQMILRSGKKVSR